jgi:hypothetical protein
MSNWLRSLFGFGPAATTRTVIGKISDIDLKNVAYIRDSGKRLSALHQLLGRYRGSVHEPKLKAAWEKSKKIHEYLLSKNRLHELELFHLQHTDHFINAFTAIIDAHQKHTGTKNAAPKLETLAEAAAAPPAAERNARRLKTVPVAEMVRPPARQEPLFNLSDPPAATPVLTVPAITINTFIKIPYRTEEAGNKLSETEIGCASSPYQKEEFLLYVSDHLGLSDITYVGNALVNIPNSNGSTPTGMVPIIQWQGFMYALNLNDFRLFPVKVFRRSA